MATICRIERVLSIKDIKPNPHNARFHSTKQIGQIADSIRAFGFGAPVLVDETLTLIAGHGRLRAAELLGIKEIPAIELRGLSAARKRALALADNKIGDNAGWDRERLAVELPELSELLIEDGLDVSVTGFSAAELDQLQVDFEEDSSDPDDDIHPGWRTGPAVGERGGLWLLGQHRLLCGDARREPDLDRLMGSNRAAMAFADVPYNVAVRSIGSRGRTKHAEFRMASGEMSRPEYVNFLVAGLGNSSRVSRNGAVHFVCCDWRHVTDIIEAGRLVYDEVLNIGLGQVERWARFILSQQARVHRRIPRRQGSAFEQYRARSPRPFAFERVELRGGERIPRRTDGGTAVASDRQTCRACCRCHARLHPSR